MTTPATKITALRRQWNHLNSSREQRGLRPYSLAYLADIAGSAEAIPGEAMTISKATVASVLNGTYAAATAPAIRKRLAQCIKTKLKDLGISETVKARRKSPGSLTTIKRCNNHGYVKVGRHHYYLGGPFAGSLVTIQPHGDKDKTITAVARVDSQMAARLTTVPERTARPIDPAGNQLGYEVE